jgi:hypothetical protein
MRRGGEGGGGGPMNVLIGAFIGVLVIVAVLTLGPVLGGKLETAMPALGATSSWNATYNTNLPKASTVWTDSVSIGVIVILVFFIALAIFYVRSIG